MSVRGSNNKMLVRHLFLIRKDIDKGKPTYKVWQPFRIGRDLSVLCSTPSFSDEETEMGSTEQFIQVPQLDNAKDNTGQRRQAFRSGRGSVSMRLGAEMQG